MWSERDGTYKVRKKRNCIHILKSTTSSVFCLGKKTGLDVTSRERITRSSFTTYETPTIKLVET